MGLFDDCFVYVLLEIYRYFTSFTYFILAY